MRAFFASVIVAWLIACSGSPAKPVSPSVTSASKAPARGGDLPGWAKTSWRMRRQIDPAWLLRGGFVVDVTDGSIDRADILIRGDVIEAVGARIESADARVVDITDLYVVPGLFDLHAHIQPSRFFGQPIRGDEILRRLLDHGVTTIRALPLSTEYAVKMAALVNDGAVAGPTIVAASTMFEKTAQRTSMGFGDPRTAARWVHKEALLGARWIKLYNSMDRESLTAIVGAARAAGVRVFGHAHDVAPAEAAALGLASIEHAAGLPLSCLESGVVFDPARAWRGLAEREAWLWAHADEPACRKLMTRLRDRGTAWVPTLVVSEAMLRSGAHDGRESALTAEQTRQLDRGLALAAQLAVHLHRIGGLVGVGTDFPIDGVPIGDSVHRELELLVSRGDATPLEALQIATISSARILGLDTVLGTIEAGKIAHLAILSANPLERIENIRSIRHVVHDGRMVARATSPRNRPSNGRTTGCCRSNPLRSHSTSSSFLPTMNR